MTVVFGRGKEVAGACFDQTEGAQMGRESTTSWFGTLGLLEDRPGIPDS